MDNLPSQQGIGIALRYLGNLFYTGSADFRSNLCNTRNIGRRINLLFQHKRAIGFQDEIGVIQGFEGFAYFSCVRVEQQRTDADFET